MRWARLVCNSARSLRLPAYQDNRDDTGVIYEWLERGLSSDGDSDGVACEDSSNPNGYIPNVQVEPPGTPVPALPLLWQLLLGLGLLGSGARQLYRRQHVPPEA